MAKVGKAVFFRTRSPICLDAEQRFIGALNPALYDIEVVDLGIQKARLAEAVAAGIKSVPAVIIDGAVYHINFGCGIHDLYAERRHHSLDYIDHGAGI